jgi:hypothetical protein
MTNNLSVLRHDPDVAVIVTDRIEAYVTIARNRIVPASASARNCNTT